MTAKVDHRRLYAARHTGINHAIVKSKDVAAVSITAGHKNPAFTQRKYGGNLSALGRGLADVI